MYGYHLIKVEAVKPESTILLDDGVTRAIRRRLENSEGRRIGTLWADSVMKHTNWIYNDDALARLAGLDDETWVLKVNDRDTLWSGEWKGAWEYFKRTREIVGAGTLDDKHTSLRKSGFVYTYIQAAEDLGFADDSVIVGERLKHIESETIRLRHADLRNRQIVPDFELELLNAEPEVVEIQKPLHLQIIRNPDTTAIWSAYRSLESGNEMSLVVRWYHDNMREARSGLWDLGWVGEDDLAAGLWGKAWILGEGRYTRPIKQDTTYYILRLAERKSPGGAPDQKLKRTNEIREQYRRAGLVEWREEIRTGHVIRVDRHLWKRVKQLWHR
jgi:hypothetical protein